MYSMIADMGRERGDTVEYLQSLRDENEDLKRHIFLLESKLFAKTDTYRLIQQKNSKKSYDYP